MAASRRFTNLDHARSWVMTVAVNGTAEQLTLKFSAATLTFTPKAQSIKDTSGSTQLLDTIADSAKGFFKAGLRTGDQITISGAANGANNASFVIYDISADGGTIYLTSSGTVVNEAAGNTVKIVSPVTVPEGIAMTIHARKTNTQNIYVGTNALNAQGHNCFTLGPGDVVGLQVRRSDIVWLDADVAGEGVECIVEQNKQGVE